MQPGSWNYLLRVGYFYMQLVRGKWRELRTVLATA